MPDDILLDRTVKLAFQRVGSHKLTHQIFMRVIYEAGLLFVFPVLVGKHGDIHAGQVVSADDIWLELGDLLGPSDAGRDLVELFGEVLVWPCRKLQELVSVRYVVLAVVGLDDSDVPSGRWA